jgi:TRAP-type uncharacterized transport system substrate-binding protein
MPAILRRSLLSLRDLLITVGPFVVLALALMALAYWWLQPTPPKKVVMATGPENGAYAAFGKRYAEQLAKFGITVELRTTEGSAQNLALLNDKNSGVDLAFVQGGSSEKLRAIDEDVTDVTLESLGSLFYEPMWVFYRLPAPDAKASTGKAAKPAPPLNQLTDLKGLRVNVGRPGSGIGPLFDKLIDANGLARTDFKLSNLGSTPAVMGLLGGELDAVVLVSAPEAVLVQMLLRTPGIGLLNFDQGEAYARRFSFLSPVTLPRGIVDLAQDIPSQDVKLIAPTATLVAQSDTHPALLQLFAQAAVRVHGDSGWFNKEGVFPNALYLERPLADEARRMYTSGPPFLQRHMPFWLANLVERMWVVLIPILAVLLPLSRIVPPLYEFRVRSRIFRWYGKLRGIEDELASGNARPATLLDELNALDRKVEAINVPLSHADELYALRSHIQLVRKKLKMLNEPLEQPAAA